MRRNRTKTILLAAAACLLLALLCETALFALRKGGEGQLSWLEVSDADCGRWEFRPENGGYFALANNSYFSYRLETPMDAANIRIFLSRQAGDDTELVLYCTGVVNGVSGEFVFALAGAGDGVYTAELNVRELSALRIYPTEQVRSTVSFGGFVLNEGVQPVSIRLGELLLFAFGFGLLCYGAAQLRLHRKKLPLLGLWLGGWLLLGFLAAGVGVAASAMFTASGALGDLLPVAAVLAVSAALAALWFCASRRDLAVRAGCLVFLLAALFCFANLPLRVPDEAAHWLRAYTISCGDFGFDGEFVFPQQIAVLQRCFVDGGFSSEMSGVDAVVAYLNWAGDPSLLPTPKCEVQLLLPYLLPGAVMAPFRMLGADPLILLYIGRLVNAALFAVSVFAALRMAKRLRFLVLVSAFWPLTLFVCGSLSYDALYMSAFLLLLGAALGEPTKRNILVFAAAFAVMVHIKPTACFLLLLVFFLAENGRQRLRLALLFAAAAALLYGGALLYAEVFAGAPGRAELLPGVDVAGQVRFVLSNPLRFLMVVLVDGYQNSYYLFGNGLMGLLDQPLPLTTYLAPALAVLAAVFGSSRAREQLRKGESAVLLALAVLCYGITVTGFYCVSSSLGSTSILGVQARYLIPCLPALVGSGSRLLAAAGVRTNARSSDELICWLCAALGVLAGCELFLQSFLM